MRKFTLYTALFVLGLTASAQTLTITPNTFFPCKGDEVEYTLSINWGTATPIPWSCMTIFWNNSPISGQGTTSATFRWNSIGLKTLSVSVISTGSGSGGGGIQQQQYEPLPSPGEIDFSYPEEDHYSQCGWFDDSATINVNVGNPGNGSLYGYADTYYACQGGQITLTASPSGDAVAGWLGWYNSSGIKISSGSSLTATVSSTGTYEARATIGSGHCSSTKNDFVTISQPRTFSLSEVRLVGDKTVYDGIKTSGTIELVNSGIIPIEKWLWKKGTDSWKTYEVTAAKSITFDEIFNEQTLFRALIRKDCPEQPNQYTPSVTINVVEYIPDYHSITSTSYNNNGKISKSTQYFDNAGKALQSQTWNPEDETIFASEPLYDDYNRSVGQTLSAPIGRETFGYKVGFATKGGNKLSESDWSDEVAQGMDKGNPNTLGYYYSSNNTSDEGLIPETGHPYSVTSFYEDGSGEQKTSSMPGDFHFLKSGNNPIQKTLPVFDGELRHYGAIRNILVGQGGVPDRLVKKVVVDANGNEAIVYQDEAGNIIASAISGGPFYTDPITTPNTGNWIEVHIPKGQLRSFSSYQVVDLISGNTMTGDIGQGFYKMKKASGELSYKPTYTNFTYNFYDNKGRLVGSMTPKGTQQIVDQNGLGSITEAEDLPYSTIYTYDFQGRLTEMTEADAGTTKYVYRKDGQIRFSQNANQASQSANTYSYTNYDNLGRPIESGECSCIASFDSANPDDNSAFDPAGGDPPSKRNWIKTYYDIPIVFGDRETDCPEQTGPPYYPCDPIIIQGFEYNGMAQEFVSGAVSSTESEKVQSWYSYDEQGRVTWFLQHFKQLDKYFLIQYEYDFLGNVTKVAFQPQTYENEVSEAYWHLYAYDKNQRLRTVHTAVHPETSSHYDPYLHATYEYYQHGPLKRVILAPENEQGQNGIQGIDYTYTPQGWLKAINHPVRSFDPGQDGVTNSVQKDYFGMTLEYFEGDYSRSDKKIGSLDLDDTQVPQQFNGNIRAMVFGEGDNSNYSSTYQQSKFYNYEQELSFSSTLSNDLNETAEESITLSDGFNSNGHSVLLQVKPDVQASQRIVNTQNAEVYAYTYDEKYQLKKADYSVDGAETNTYDVSIDGYDENGNIDGIDRYNDDPNTLRDDFEFNYIPGTNRLLSVTHPTDPTKSYIDSISYNQIGQVTGIEYTDPERTDFNIAYDVTGKVTLVTNMVTSEPIIEFTYDDRGFRVSKKVGYIEEWYVRDASGQVMAIYHRDTDPATSNSLAQIELPIYGATKIGTTFKNPDHYKYIYELTDHLGNVRALATKLGMQATASMETENETYEEQYFDNIDNRNPNKYRSGNESVVTNATYQFGPATTFRVKAGDEVSLEVFATYDVAETFSALPLTEALKNSLGNQANGGVVGVEGGSLSGGVTNVIDDLLGLVSGNQDEPKAYLQFVLLDENFSRIVTPEVSYKAVTGNFDADESNFEKLELSFAVPADGYVYAYIVNESDKVIHFDDFTQSVIGPRMIRATDYYPFGAVAKVWNNPEQTQQEKYRHGYQGQYAEADSTTGWNAFELRMYDPLIGRWLQVDPARQHASPYLSMGNDPVNKVDSDGGEDWYKNEETGEVKWVEGSAAIDGWQNLGAIYQETVDNVTFTYNQLDLITVEEHILTAADWVSDMPNGVKVMQCFAATKQMVSKSGATVALNFESNWFKLGGAKQNLEGYYMISKGDNSGAYDYLNSQIDLGNSVMLGVDYKWGHPGNSDKLTDHWIAISSRITHLITGQVEYTFFDPGTAFRARGTDPNNILSMQSGLLRGTFQGKMYDVISIRKNN